MCDGERNRSITDTDIDEKFWSLATCCIAASYVFIAITSTKDEISAAYASTINFYFYVIGVATVLSSSFSIGFEVLCDNGRPWYWSWMISGVVLALNIPIAISLYKIDFISNFDYLESVFR